MRNVRQVVARMAAGAAAITLAIGGASAAAPTAEARTVFSGTCTVNHSGNQAVAYCNRTSSSYLYRIAIRCEGRSLLWGSLESYHISPYFGPGETYRFSCPNTSDWITFSNVIRTS